MFSRRDALKTLGVARVALRNFRLDAEGTRGFRLQAPDRTLLAIAEVVLPGEADRTAAVAAFTSWIDNYTEGADTDHGYGNTRIRSVGPSPARNYATQIGALDAAARAKGASAFAAAALDVRRVIVEQAIADAKVERLPARPTGAHVATDLMGHYFNSSTGQDVCYRAAIARDACRGLSGSDKPPQLLSPRVSAASEPRKWSEPAKPRASERVRESERRSRSASR